MKIKVLLLSLGLTTVGLLACGQNKSTVLDNSAPGEANAEKPLISLKGALLSVRQVLPAGAPPNALVMPTTVVDIQYTLPCWASLEEGYPKASAFQTADNKFIVEFNALARDNRVPNGISCRGLTTDTLTDVVVGAGIIGESEISLVSLEIAQ